MGEALSFPEGGADGSGAGGSGQVTSVTSESVLLSELIQMLSQRPKNSLLLTDLTALMPSNLRQRVKEHGGLQNWIQRFPSVFQIVGTAGKEMVVLTVGRMREAAEVVAAETRGQVDAPVAPVAPAVSPAGTTVGAAVGAAGGPAGAESANGNDQEEAEALEETHVEKPNRSDAFDEDTYGDSAVQLRGLPYKASVEEIRRFLGEHCSRLIPDTAIHLVLNRDGRPSGFARVIFDSPEAAMRARDELHLQTMDDRYVEVFLFNERPNKGRKTQGPDGISAVHSIDAIMGIGKEQVVRELRQEMSDPSRRKVLLSMLGVALSPGVRSYLKHIDQGLKNFLSQYPNEFFVEGAKGCESVTYTPLPGEAKMGYSTNAGSFSGAQRSSLSTLGPAEAIPASPKPSKSPPQSGRCLATPSNWGTPNPWEQFMAPFPHGAPAGPAAGDGAWGPAPAWNLGMPMQVPGMAGPYWQGSQGNNFDAATLWQLEVAAATQAAQLAAQAAARGAGAMAHGQFKSETLSASATGTNAAAKPFTPMNTTPDSGLLEGAPAGGLTLRLRGLPFVSTEQDILAFFAQHDIVDRVVEGAKAVTLLVRTNGRPSGQALVQMRDKESADLAQQVLSGQYMGNRYIEVFLQGDESLEALSPMSLAPPSGKIAGSSPNKANAPKTLSLACGLAGGSLTEDAARQGPQPPGPVYPLGQQPWQGGNWMPNMMPGAQMEQSYMGVNTGGGGWEDLFSFLQPGPAADVLAAHGAHAAQMQQQGTAMQGTGSASAIL